MLVRDDRSWVAGGRTEPWLALFDAVTGVAPLVSLGRQVFQGMGRSGT
jgi:hypothetical protein